MFETSGSPRSVGLLHETQICPMASHTGILCSKRLTQQVWIVLTLHIPKKEPLLCFGKVTSKPLEYPL